MPFGLSDAPATFQPCINGTLSEYLDRFCFAVLDDNIVYSETLEEHIIYIRQVLQRLSDAGLHLNPKKCRFHLTETTYLALIVRRDGVCMQPEQVQAIQELKTPNNLTDGRSFLGFANVYRRVIHGFSSTLRPLTELTRIDQCFHWDQDQQLAFQKLI